MTVAQAAENAQEAGQVLVVDGNIQVGMRACLPAQVRIYRPTAIDNDRDACDFSQVADPQGFFLIHFGRLTWCWAERDAFQDFFKGIWLTWILFSR